MYYNYIRYYIYIALCYMDYVDCVNMYIYIYYMSKVTAIIRTLLNLIDQSNQLGQYIGKT